MTAVKKDDVFVSSVSTGVCKFHAPEGILKG